MSWLKVIVWVVIGLILILIVLSALFAAVMWLLMRYVATPKTPSVAVENGRKLFSDARVVVAIGAHPDDIEWYTGGTLATLASAGKKVVVVIMADGGSEQLVRQEEQLRAADILGYTKVIFFGYQDGALEKVPREELVKRLAEVFDEVKPDTVIAYDSEKEFIIYHHSDHRAGGWAAIEAANRAKIPHVYLYHSGRPNTWTDITKVIDLKQRALAAHRSQRSPWPLLPLDFMFGNYNKRLATLEGAKVGLRYTEPFRKLPK